MPRLTDLLPLRSTAVWRQFSVVQPVPIRYGRTAGQCIPYSSDRRTWVWADHPSQGVDAITVDDAPVDNWEWRNALDSTGKAITFVEFAEAVDLGAAVKATGRGRMGDAGLLESPADIIADLCALAGVAAPALDELREQLSGRSLRLAYSISERRTLQAELRDIAASIGGIYSSAIAGYVRLLPVTDSPLVTVGERYIRSGACDLETLRTRYVARYAFQDGQPTAGLESAILTAEQDILGELELRCVADGRTAADVVQRQLQRVGVPVWRMTALDVPGKLTTGQPVTVASRDHSGTGVVLSAQWDPVRDRSAAAIELRLATAGTVTLIRQGSAVAFDRYSGGTVVTVNDERVITLTYNDGSPIVDAQVILNGSTTRLTDGAGRVAFPVSLMPPGTHELLIIPPGEEAGQGFGMTVTV